MGDREHPGAKPALVSLEAGDVAGDLEEHLAEDVLRVRRGVRAQVAENHGGEPVVEFLPGCLAPLPGRLQKRSETLLEHRGGGTGVFTAESGRTAVLARSTA